MKNYCECDDRGVLAPGLSHLYDETSELPFVNHQPNKCLCENDLAEFRRKGEILTLCSCCHKPPDERITQTDASVMPKEGEER